MDWPRQKRAPGTLTQLRPAYALGWSRLWTVVAALGLTGCRGQQHSETRSESVAVEVRHERVVSLHDVTTEIVLRLGRKSRLVGVAELVNAPETLRADVASLAKVAGLESILAKQPTLVLGTATIAERDPELVAALRARGIEVRLLELAELAGLQRSVLALGQALAAGRAAKMVVAELERGLLACKKTAGDGALRVFVYDCCDPPFTAGGHGVLNELISLAGGRNIFADVEQDWSTVSWEDVLARKPEVVVIHSYAMASQRDVAGKREQLKRWPQLSGLPTVVMPLRLGLGGLASVEGCQRLRTGFDKVRVRPREP